MINKKVTGLLQASLLIVSVFATANFLSLVSGNELLDDLGIGSDSAVQTCVEAVDGAVCQQLHEDVCDSLCLGPCIPGERTEVADCEVGVCVDEDEGLCSAGATKKHCEDKGGRFVAGSINEVAECERHCCILGNEAQFVTEERCEILSRELGIDMEFDTTVYNADLCVMFGKEDKMGACVWPSDQEGFNECKFTSLGECVQTSEGNVDFHEGLLCSHPDLNSVCERQNHTACVPGLDGVYWFDSCGNQENIFYVNKDDSWNDGEVLEVNDSCLMGPPGDRLRNQETCGNCNRLLGSACGDEVEGQELRDDPDSGVVCRDLGCYEEDDTRRENGETWCVYTTDFGPSADVPLLGAISNYINIPFGGSMIRSKSAPGGEHFRKSCINGEIDVEPCGPYRTGICVETQTEVTSSETFSTAACVPNRWAECLNYNAGGDGALADLTNAISQISSIPIVGQYAGRALQMPAEAEKVKVLNMMLTCESDPDCFVKTVNVDKDFKFPMCIPKYSPGFYKKEMDQNDAGICAFGSQMCSTVWVKESTAFTFGATAHWECKANCDCIDGSTPSDAKPSRKFISEMHALCVSLGDCGAKTNYVGDVGGLLNGYELQKAEYEGMPKAPDKDRKKKKVSGLPPLPVDDSTPREGAFIDAGAYGNGTGSSSSGLFGFGDDEEGEGGGGGGGGGVVGAPEAPGNTVDNQMTTTLASSLGAGGTMIGLSAAAQAGWLGTTFATQTFAVSAAGWSQALSFTGGAYPGIVPAVVPPGAAGPEALIATAPANPAALAFQGAAIGAGIAVAVVSILVGVSGIGAGVGAGGVIGYTASAAVSGGLIGTSVAVGAATAAVEAGTATAAQTALAGWATGSGSSVAPWLGPVGIAIAIILVVDIIAQWISGVGEIRTVEIYFDCKPWTAPATSRCDECGDNGLSCNQYNCETLGAECEFLAENEGAVDEDLPVCVAVEFNDISGPRIDELLNDALVVGYDYDNVEGLGTESASFEVEKVSSEDGCVNQFEEIRFGFVLDEAGECAYSFEPGMEFGEMYTLGGGGLRYQHRHSIGEIWEQMDPDSEEVQEFDVYIKCKDYQLDESRGGNVGGENVMSFCVNPIDLTAPYIVGTNIPDGYVAPYSEDNITIIVTFDEHVESASIDFGNAEYEMSCSDNVCVVEVPIEFGDNEYHVTAVDLEGNELSGGEPIVVRRSESPLEIVSVEHDGEDLGGQVITRGNLLNSVEVVVETEGGVDGTADCAYKLNGYGEAYFEETGGGEKSVHRQEFTTLIGGYYEMEISCIDTAGNGAFEEVNFTVEADLGWPSVSRIYDDSGTLIVVTDEPATCSYANDGCGFNVDEGEMMNGENYVHSTSLDYEMVYYVKCEDEYENQPSECSIIVSGSEF